MILAGIFFVLIQVQVFGQVSHDEFIVPDSALGRYNLTDGYTGDGFILNADGSFEKVEQDCLRGDVIDGGSWLSEGPGHVILCGRKGVSAWVFVRWSRFTYMVPADRLARYKHDKAEWKYKLRNVRPVSVAGWVYDAEYLVGYNLSRKYYSMEADPKTP